VTGRALRHGRYRLLVTFLVPPLLLYGYFVLSPYVQMFVIAATDWRGLSPSYEIVGLDNFRQLLRDQYVLDALRHNLVLLLLLPVITIALGLFFASMLNVGGRGKVAGVRGSGAYKVVYFFPQVISIAVIGVLWKQLYNPRSGLLNGFLEAVGLDGLARPWLGDPTYAFWAVMAVMVWANVGFYVVLFGAAMQSVPRDVYEAALLDGAGRLATLWRVTIPLLWDSVQVAWVYLAILALDGFALVQIMTNGGPSFATDVAGLRIYETAFGEAKFGYASAIGVALFFVTLSIAVLALRATRRERIEF